MFFMSGLMGKFVFVIPMTVTLALFISFGEVVIALPAHIVRSLNKHKPGKRAARKESWFARCKEEYGRCVLRFLKYRYPLGPFFRDRAGRRVLLRGPFHGFCFIPLQWRRPGLRAREATLPGPRWRPRRINSKRLSA